MSSKKQRRRERRRQEAAGGKKGPSRATLFILVVVGALLAIGIGAAVFGDSGPPDSDAVWSAEHGHWH